MSIKVNDCFLIPKRNQVIRAVAVVDGFGDLKLNEKEIKAISKLLDVDPIIIFDNGWKLTEREIRDRVEIMPVKDPDLARSIYE